MFESPLNHLWISPKGRIPCCAPEILIQKLGSGVKESASLRKHIPNTLRDHKSMDGISRRSSRKMSMAIKKEAQDRRIVWKPDLEQEWQKSKQWPTLPSSWGLGGKHVINCSGLWGALGNYWRLLEVKLTLYPPCSSWLVRAEAPSLNFLPTCSGLQSLTLPLWSNAQSLYHITPRTLMGTWSCSN